MTQEEKNKLILDQWTKESLAQEWINTYLKYKTLKEESEILNNKIKKLKEYIYNTENWYIDLGDRIMEKPYILVEDLKKQIEEN